MLAPVDWIVIGAYLAFSLAVGVVLARRAGKSTNEFFISGRNLPWWLAGTSMVATSFASDTPLFVTGIVRAGGVGTNWIWWVYAVGGMLSVFLLARLWRRAKVVTDVELTELRYSGKGAAALRAFRAAYMAGPINCITMAWVILAMIKLMKVLFGIDPFWAVVICTSIAVVYSVLSGFWGVVVTDLVQFVIAMGGSILLAVLAVRRVGGLGGLVAHFAAPERAKFLHFFPHPPEGATLSDPAFWTAPVFAFAVFISVQWWANKNADGGGAIIQRMNACKDERNSLLATLWFNIANYALRPWPWILVALASMIVLPAAVDGESAYPLMIRELMPAGLMGLMIASFLGAFMSTIDTHLNLSSSYLVNDVYRRFIRKRASESHYVLVSRLASVGFMIAAGVIAYYSVSIRKLWVFLIAFSSGVGLVYILRWFWWRVNAWSEISAMIASSVIAGGLHVVNVHLARADVAPFSYPVILLVTVGGSTLVWLVVTFLTPPVSDDRLVAFYRRVRPSGAWGGVAAKAGSPPAAGLRRGIVLWVAGTVMVLAATFAPGKFLLGAPVEGAISAVIAVVCAIVVWRGIASGDTGIEPLRNGGDEEQSA